ncbi:hypothetical protein HY745_15020, partial [Candidatus Desantisbacteria bacterium]|nr:hypothetical protein [Candidatus Desantisbacteria bacterium]
KQFKDTLSSQEEISPDAEYENFIRNLRAENSELINEAMNLPKRCRIKRTAIKQKKGVIVFGKKGEEFAFKFADEHNIPHALTLIEALKIFEADINESALKPSKHFNEIYKNICASLFSQKKEVALDKGKKDTILKIEVLKQKLIDEKDYLEDLYYVLTKLDALPGRYAKLIRAISIENLKEDFEELKKEVPHSYLLNIIERENLIEEGKESLILSEELD